MNDDEHAGRITAESGGPMSGWTSEELRELETSGEVQVAGRREDGSPRTLVTIWDVVVDEKLYLRSVRGPEGRWYRGVARYFEGFLSWGGKIRPVTFTPDSTQDAAVDAAYTAKYGNGPDARAIIDPLARQTTMRVDPR